MIRKAYLVTYSTGSYDTFYLQNDKVFFSKKKAKARCKELNKKHKLIKSMFLSNKDKYGNIIELSEEDQNKTFCAVEYEADCYREEHPEEFPDLWKKYMTSEESIAWAVQEELNDIKYKEVLHQIVAKYHPEWSKKDIIKAIEIEHQNETVREQEFGEADIEEIEVDIDE